MRYQNPKTFKGFKPRGFRTITGSLLRGVRREPTGLSLEVEE